MSNFFWCEKCKKWVAEISTVTTTVRRCPHCNSEIKPHFCTTSTPTSTSTSTNDFDEDDLNNLIGEGFEI